MSRPAATAQKPDWNLHGTLLRLIVGEKSPYH